MYRRPSPSWDLTTCPGLRGLGGSGRAILQPPRAQPLGGTRPSHWAPARQPVAVPASSKGVAVAVRHNEGAWGDDYADEPPAELRVPRGCALVELRDQEESDDVETEEAEEATGDYNDKVKEQEEEKKKEEQEEELEPQAGRQALLALLAERWLDASAADYHLVAVDVEAAPMEPAKPPPGQPPHRHMAAEAWTLEAAPMVAAPMVAAPLEEEAAMEEEAPMV